MWGGERGIYSPTRLLDTTARLQRTCPLGDRDTGARDRRAVVTVGVRAVGAPDV